MAADKFRHRIDGTPKIGASIEFYKGSAVNPRRGTIVESKDGFYGGVGDDVRVLSEDGRLLVPSQDVDYWRYS